jgi:phage/plasmid-associated DNA primase
MQASGKNEGIEFSDSDDECEHGDEIQEEVSLRLQENVHSIVRGYKDFLSEPSFINNKGDTTTNIVDLYAKKCYCIPNRKISKLMKFLEIMRRKKLKMMVYEKQQEYSGIMEDLDVRINHGGESPINHTHYHRLCIMMFKVLLKYIHFPEEEMGTQKEFYVAFTKKPKILHDNDGDFYKDGRHMLIPGIQITREFKKLINDEICEKKLLEKVFKEIVPHKSMTRTEFLDVNSAHVGTFFIGSSSKINSPAYILDVVYKVQITVGELDDIIPVKVENFAGANCNISHEFSLNWAKNPDKGGIISKAKYDIQPKYSTLLDQYKTKSRDVDNHDEFDEESDKYYNELSILNMHDPDTGYIKSILDILHPKRSEDYSLWFDVLCALAHTSTSYKALGEYFSRKSPERFDASKFEQVWESILVKKGNNISIGSLHYWAKMDNPDRYEEVRHRSIFNLLYKKIYDITVEGSLEHYDVAEILHSVLKDKYIYDKYDCEGGSWYEFILENEPMRQGELYKWRKYDGKAPNSLLRYMSTILPALFRKILDRIKSTLDECSTELAKYHYQIYKNFQKACRNLKNSGFKRSTITEAEQLFERIGFSELLDADPNLKGVANGILQLGKKCKLITGFHGHFVSKYTSATFKEFNPYDSTTKKVLIALRNLFPDCEPDTFDYIMHYLASTLDGHKKESIMLLLVGRGSNGKSFMVELHKGAIGAAYGVKMPLAFLTSRAKDAESATPALMQLKDAHFAYYSESNKFEILNMAKIKEFTGQETMAGRKLHQDYVNFKPKCHHLVASNNDFEISGTDHGTWRRLDYVTMKIKFCNLATDDYDENNPYERVADPSLGSKWAEDEEVLAAYLGILSYYYESLHNKYDGKVRNVPHPHIVKATEEFRSRQDRVNNFLTGFLVKCPDEEYEMPMTTAKEHYIKWHESNYPGSNKDYQRLAVDQLENSIIQKFVKKTNRGNFLKGYRVLEMSEQKNDDEEYYTIIAAKKIDSVKVKKESAIDLHERLCQEYDTKPFENSNGDSASNQKIKESTNASNTFDESDSDSDIDEIIQKVETNIPKKNINSDRFNNINTDALDINGIKKPKSVEYARSQLATRPDKKTGGSKSTASQQTTEKDSCKKIIPKKSTKPNEYLPLNMANDDADSSNESDDDSD